MENDLDIHLPSIANRDMRAFARWMAGAEERVRLSLYSFARTVDVESVVQDTMLRVWQVAPRFEPDGKPNGLLRLAIRIAGNLAISEVRRMRARPVEQEEIAQFAEANAANTTVDPLLRKTIRECAESLPAKPRQVFMAGMGARGGRRDRELAQGLGMKKNTFLKNFGRARQFLIECLEEHGVKVEVPR
jgi:RNA polymerase sigma-70 factor (ECF subfamily)